jgi:hypothetical protein
MQGISGFSQLLSLLARNRILRLAARTKCYPAPMDKSQILLTAKAELMRHAWG